MMVYALRQYPMSRAADDHEVARCSASGGCNFAQGNTGRARTTFSQFSYYSFDLPDILGADHRAAIVAAGIVLVGARRCSGRTTTERGRAPGVNMVVPFVALYVWWLPITRQFEFYFPADAALPLAAAFWPSSTRWRMTCGCARSIILRSAARSIAVGTVLAGWLAFEFAAERGGHRRSARSTRGRCFLLHRGDACSSTSTTTSSTTCSGASGIRRSKIAS